MRKVRYKPVLGFPGYKVGDDGSVWSCIKMIPQKGGRFGFKSKIGKRRLRRLQPGTNNRGDGYGLVVLRRKGRSYTRTIHRLVLETFIGLRPPGCQCRHLDGNTSNSCLSNLQWGSPKENAADKYAHGTQQYGESHHRLKYSEKRILRILSKGYSGMKPVEISKEENISREYIARILRGDVWSHLHQKLH